MQPGQSNKPRAVELLAIRRPTTAHRPGPAPTRERLGQEKHALLKTVVDLRRNPENQGFKTLLTRGAGVALSVERPTLDFSSGHALMVRGIEPCDGSAEPAWDSLFFSPVSVPPTLSLSLKIKK